MKCSVYLDIETTGLSLQRENLTVIGLHVDYGNQSQTIQLVGNEIFTSQLIRLISKDAILYTYNGTRFDLPFIRAKLGVDLTEHCAHRDLMYDCWAQNIYGGLKEVERKLGIERKTVGIDGFMAVQLWYDYERYGDEQALATLLEYNREDVVNLKALRHKLNI